MTEKIKIYQEQDGQIKFDISCDKENIWLSLEQMAELFDIDKSAISRHIKNVLKHKELDQDSAVAIFAIAGQEKAKQVTRNLEHYNLDMIMSVGYRANSVKAAQFRIWATNILKNHLVKSI